MIEPDGFTFNPSEPGNETKVRIVRSRETPCAADELKVEPARWKVGDDLGDYVIEASIGSGVTSSVYRVREKATGRTFAMKIMRTRCEDTLTASRVGFRRMQGLSHPSLVRCDRMVLVGDYLAFTMEEVTGRRLIDVINETRSHDRTVGYELAIQLLHDIGGALQTIHIAGLVHRDVKPDNVMIDDQGLARLIDYGLVGSYDPESDPDAKRGYLAGTYWYMAPESITKQIYPPACDVYALGCMLLELIADRARLPDAVEGESFGQSIGSVESYLPSDTPAELAELICDMIDPAPENRPLASRLVQVKRTSQPTDLGTSNFTNGRVYGRDVELAVAERWVHSVVEGRPKRLHISGDSGVGKTWFLNELQRRIRSNAWFQVFDSTCRERSDVPLQAFDAMADAIARRYSRDDRETLVLAPRHALVLRQAFPSLRCVIAEPFFPVPLDVELQRRPEAGTSSGNAVSHLEVARTDALHAGVELVDRMCDYGPVFLILDDTQWADADSINVLDKLLSNAKGNTGIITVGRSLNDKFREPADCCIELKPLAEPDAIKLLRQLLGSGDFEWSEQALKRLASLGEGNPHCITQLAACVGHDGAQQWQVRLVSTNVEIEDIWQSRISQLSQDAKVAIEFLAVAGGPIRRSDLAPASNLRERCDAALKELIAVHLVYDEAPKRDSVNIIHQRISRRIIEAIEPESFRSLNNAWAVHLIDGEEVPWRAARIAGHLLKAGRDESSIPYIIQAARDAEDRFAFTEAARWHQRVAVLLDDTSAAMHWMQSVQCFEEAGCPAEAADACRTLLGHPALATLEWSEVNVLRHLAENLFRSGDIAGAKRIIQSIAARFDPAWNLSTLKMRQEKAVNAFRVHGRMTNTVSPEPYQANEAPEVPVLNSQQDAIDACIALYRPLIAYDVGHAIELLGSIYSSLETIPYATINPRIRIDAAVVGCRNPGRRRRRNAERLNRFVEDAEQTGNSLMVAEANCGVAFRHLAACDWASTINPSMKAVMAFRSQRPRDRFGEALAHLPLNWSCLWLGRFRDLRANIFAMTNDADERNDQCVARFLSVGLGCAAQLLDGRPDAVCKYHAQPNPGLESRKSSWLQLLDGFSFLVRSQYEDEITRAIRFHRVLVSEQRKTLLRQTQLLRVLCLQFEGSIYIRHAFQRNADRDASLSVARRVCQDLQSERIPYANAIANYFSAQIHEVNGERNQCVAMYEHASSIADSLDLVPLRLAANDRIAAVRGKTKPRELENFLALEGVKVPKKFARLYCSLR